MPGKQRPHPRVSKKGKVFTAGSKSGFLALAKKRGVIFHGTEQRHVASILRTGFRSPAYFGRLKDAKVFASVPKGAILAVQRPRFARRVTTPFGVKATLARKRVPANRIRGYALTTRGKAPVRGDWYKVTKVFMRAHG